MSASSRPETSTVPASLDVGRHGDPGRDLVVERRQGQRPVVVGLEQDTGEDRHRRAVRQAASRPASRRRRARHARPGTSPCHRPSPARLRSARPLECALTLSGTADARTPTRASSGRTLADQKRYAVGWTFSGDIIIEERVHLLLRCVWILWTATIVAGQATGRPVDGLGVTDAGRRARRWTRDRPSTRRTQPVHVHRSSRVVHRLSTDRGSPVCPDGHRVTEALLHRVVHNVCAERNERGNIADRRTEHRGSLSATAA